MANIQINLTNGTQDRLENYLGFVGDFQRTKEEPKVITSEAELQKQFGTIPTDDYAAAKELLDQNVPLLVQGIQKEFDEVDSIRFGNAPITEPLDGIHTNAIDVESASYTLNDGVYNLTQAPFINFDAVQPIELNYITNGVYALPGAIDILVIRIPWSNQPAAFAGGLLNIGQRVTFSRCVNQNGTDMFPGLENEPFTVANVQNGNSYKTVILTWDNATTSNDIMNYAVFGSSFTSAAVMDLISLSGLSLELTVGSVTQDTFAVGDDVQFIGADQASNNNQALTIVNVNFDAVTSEATVNLISSFTFVADPNTSGNGQVEFIDRSVENTITIPQDWTSFSTSLSNIGTVEIVADGGQPQIIGFSSLALDGSNNTVLNLTQPFVPGTSNIVKMPFANNNAQAVQFDTLPTTAINVGGVYGFTDGTTNRWSMVMSSFTIGTTNYFVLGTNLGFVPTDLLVATTGGGIFMYTQTKGDNSDISFSVTQVPNGHQYDISLNNEVVESWILFTGFGQAEVDDFNEVSEFCYLEYTDFTATPQFFTHTFGGNYNLPTQAERADAINNFDLIPIPAMYGSINLPVEIYDFKFPKTIFMEIPETYTLTQAKAKAASYNRIEGRNVHLSYGKFNSIPLNTYAAKAFYLTGQNGDALTQLPYANLGRTKPTKINTILKAAEIVEFDNVGIVTMDSLNGSYSDYRLINNTTPYKKNPLGRANVNFILNKMIWEAHQIEFVNQNKVLNIELFGVINTQFRQLLANYSNYLEVANVIDDSGAANFDSLVVNNKQDVLNGHYKVILELKFYNTLKTLTVAFNVA